MLRWIYFSALALACLQPLRAAGDAAAAETASRWEADIQAFETADRDRPPPHDAVLFIGSSSIRRWASLAEDFPAHPVINRGFGGSHVSDSVQFANRIVLPYRPRLVVLYAGENDITAGKTPETVASDFKSFVRKLPGEMPVVFISLKPSPSRRHLQEPFEETNRLIEEYCRGDARLHFVDVYQPMLDENGAPRAELFVSDNLHLNGKGYALWTSILRPVLNEVPAKR